MPRTMTEVRVDGPLCTMAPALVAARAASRRGTERMPVKVR